MTEYTTDRLIDNSNLRKGGDPRVPGWHSSRRDTLVGYVAERPLEALSPVGVHSRARSAITAHGQTAAHTQREQNKKSSGMGRGRTSKMF